MADEENDDWIRILTEDPKFLKGLVCFMAEDGSKNRERVKKLQNRVEILSEAVASVLPYYNRLPDDVMAKLNCAVNWNCVHGVNVHQQRCPECQELP